MSQFRAYLYRYQTRFWKIIFCLNMGLAISYVGLFVMAAQQDLLWRADFTAYYTGAALVRDGHGGNLYDLALQTVYQQQILNGRSFWDGVLPFNYPPYFALVLLPLAYTPVSIAFWIWSAMQVGCLAWLLRLIWKLAHSWENNARWLFISMIVAFPPLMRALLQGTSSLFTLVCIFEIYLALLKKRSLMGGDMAGFGCCPSAGNFFNGFVCAFAAAMENGVKWDMLGSSCFCHNNVNPR